MLLEVAELLMALLLMLLPTMMLLLLLMLLLMMIVLLLMLKMWLFCQENSLERDRMAGDAVWLLFLLLRAEIKKGRVIDLFVDTYILV